MSELGLIEQLQARLDSLERRIGLNEFEQGLLHRLDLIESALSTLSTQGTEIMSEITDLVAQVTETKGIEASAVVALQGLRDQINTLVSNATELADLKAQLTSLTTDLDTSETALAAAIATPPAAPAV